MTLIRRESNYPTWSNLLDGFMHDSWLDRESNANSTLPSVNIKESEDAFEIEVAAPGLSKEDFKVELNQDRLSISAEKKTETETNDSEQYTRKEFCYSNFMRSFKLPNVIENESIEARYENGVLLIAIPKKEEAKPKPARYIEIA